MLSWLRANQIRPFDTSGNGRFRSMISYAASRPELVEGEVPPLPRAEQGWRATVGTVAYATAILVGVFIFPRAAAVLYLTIALRGVLVSGHEGRLSIRLLR